MKKLILLTTLITCGLTSTVFAETQAPTPPAQPTPGTPPKKLTPEEVAAKWEQFKKANPERAAEIEKQKAEREGKMKAVKEYNEKLRAVRDAAVKKGDTDGDGKLSADERVAVKKIIDEETAKLGPSPLTQEDKDRMRAAREKHEANKQGQPSALKSGKPGDLKSPMPLPAKKVAQEAPATE